MYPPNYWKKQEGQWFGSKYLLKEFLGCGAYGAVFRADEMLAERVMQSVAIKIVIADMDNLDNQLAELQLSVRLRHPHLINGITCEQGEIFGDLCLGLVMELADDTLEGYYAKQSQGLSVETVTKIAQHLAEGLKALHEDGITHRDLKPANVLLVKDQWKLGDFGIARSLQDKNSTYTSPSQQIGTVAYMPPEAYSGRISPAWDVWALGVMIHQLLSGQHPFPTDLAPELMRMVLMEEPKIDPQLPSPLREIVTGCLIKEPEQRWNIEQILKALKLEFPTKETDDQSEPFDDKSEPDDDNSNVSLSKLDKSNLNRLTTYFEEMPSKILKYHHDHGASKEEAGVIAEYYSQMAKRLESTNNQIELAQTIQEVKKLKNILSRYKHKKEYHRWDVGLENKVLSVLYRIQSDPLIDLDWYLPSENFNVGHGKPLDRLDIAFIRSIIGYLEEMSKKIYKYHNDHYATKEEAEIISSYYRNLFAYIMEIKSHLDLENAIKILDKFKKILSHYKHKESQYQLDLNLEDKFLQHLRKIADQTSGR